MRVELPSGGWVELRDRLKAADKFAVQDSIRLQIEDGVQLFTGGIQNSMRNALLGRVITSWSFEGVPIPSQNIAGDDIIGDTLDLDDYDALTKAVEPLMEKVSFSAAANANPNRTKRSGR